MSKAAKKKKKIKKKPTSIQKVTPGMARLIVKKIIRETEDVMDKHLASVDDETKWLLFGRVINAFFQHFYGAAMEAVRTHDKRRALEEIAELERQCKSQQ